MPPENLLNPAGLEYAITAPFQVIFGQEAYPSIPDKAAVYLFTIVSGHLFQDGNKRTGLTVALLFLLVNDYDIVVPSGYEPDHSNDLRGGSPEEFFVYDFTMQVAGGQHDLDAVRNWFNAHTTQR